MANITKEDVKQFLNDHYLMQLATVSGDQPGVSVLLYTIDDNLNFYFGTHSDSYKVKSLNQNPKVSLVVWEFGKIQVQVNGVSEIIESKEEQNNILDKLADAATKDINFWPPLFRIKGGEYTIIKIRPEWMRVLDLSTNSVRQEESPFVEINLK
jgi:nitroimidazol reductase NimA-like FMN-containing flavoprotein (pyridoxamine 5'-phosphate oxidase superfamily)